MQQMLNMFAQKDLSEALKNAVPLGNMESAMTRSRPSFGRPGSRSNLNINTHFTDSVESFALETDMLTRMRKVYEAAFNKLDKAGDFQKAAFVLAELLRYVDKAVAYLEQHKEFRLAALLAEGQKLPAARVIRQWVLAGDIPRAVHIAKISGHFEEAITALGKDHQGAANKLRWELAKQHAYSGNLFTAIELAWSLQEKRSDVLNWMQQCCDANDAGSAVMLLRLADEQTDKTNEHLQKLHNLVMLPSPAQQTIRHALINEIINSRKSAARQLVANLMVRLYLEDIALGKSSYNAKLWRNLLDFGDNQVLRADVRNLTIGSANDPIPLTKVTTPLQLEFPASYGRSPCDVALLSNGCFLVAFGESGVELWTNTGKKKHAWFVPCHHIVISDTANQALLLARRSQLVSVHKFALNTLQVNYWQDIALDGWADNYDGLTWMVAKSDMLWALDLNSDDNSAVWSVSDLGGFIVQIKRETERLGIAIVSDERFELWVYQLPDLFLKERTPHFQRQFVDVDVIDFECNGKLLMQEPDRANALGLGQNPKTCQWYTADENLISDTVKLQNNWMCYCSKEQPGATTLKLVDVNHSGPNEVRLQLICIQSELIQFKVNRGNILAWTEHGRIILIDETTAQLVTHIVV